MKAKIEETKIYVTYAYNGAKVTTYKIENGTNKPIRYNRFTTVEYLGKQFFVKTTYTTTMWNEIDRFMCLVLHLALTEVIDTARCINSSAKRK